MRNYAIISLLIVVALLFTACRPQQQQELPTVFPSPTPLPAKPVNNTPVPTQAKPTNTPLPFVRPTLPPAFTDTPVPSNTPLPATNTPAPTVAIATLVPACDTFGPDGTRSTVRFQIGVAPTVYWTKVEGAQAYHISLVNEFGDELATDYTADTKYTFSADLFKAGKQYGWEVYPLDGHNIQMCYGRGDKLLPSLK